MQNVKVVIWRLGAMGSGIAEMILGKKGVDIAGVAAKRGKVCTISFLQTLWAGN
jgi:4-hydroxy-tetrahydrodipicolinate reductase